MTEIRTGIRIDGTAAGYVAATAEAEKATRKLDEAQQVANAGQRQATISAGQYQQAIRQLPAQITDVATSLASGMPAWLVAIQQGGQIRDSFGSAGLALKAITGFVSPAVAAFGTLAAAGAAVALAHSQANDEQRAFRLAIEGSGNAAGVSRGQLADYAREVSATVGTTHAAAEAIAMLVSTGRVMGSDLPKFAVVAQQSQRYLGRQVTDTVQAFAALGREPVQASLRLNESTNYLTAAVLRQIQAYEAQGNGIAAASLAQNAFAAAQSRLAEEGKNSLGSLERAWIAIGDSAAKAWNKMLGLGREETLQQQLERVQAYLDAPARRGGNAVEQEQRRARLLEQADSLREQIRLQDQSGRARSAAVDEQNDKLLKAGAAYQSGLAGIDKAGADLRLAQAKAYLQQHTDALKTAFERDEIDAGLYQSELLELQMQGFSAQLRALDEYQASLQTKQLKLNSPEELGRRAQLTSLEAQREAIRAQRAALLEAENRGDRDITPKARVGAGDSLRKLEAAQAAETSKYLIDESAKVNEEIKRASAEAADFKLMKERQFVDNVKPEWQRMVEAWGSAAQQMKDGFDRTVTSTLQAGEDAWVKFAQTSKLSVKSLVDTIIAETARSAYRKFVSAAFNFFSGGGNSNGGIDPSGKDWTDTFPRPGEGYHSGGVVGVDSPTFTRRVPGSVFAGAPRFHGGMLAADEFPAILQQGESVLTPGQMRALGGARTVQVTLINQTGTPAQATATRRADGGVEVLLTAIEDRMADRVASGEGSLTQALQGRFGLRPAF